MSTRALYTFTDNDASWNVYKHHDGYPTGAAETLTAALKWFAWTLPRFEADEFAGAFCAAGKAYNMIAVVEGERTLKQFKADEKAYGHIQHGGGIRFMPQGDPLTVACENCSDIEYRYEIKQGNGGELRIRAYAVSAWDKPGSEELLTDCKLADFAAWAEAEEKRNQAA